MGNLGDSLEVRNVIFWVSNALNIYRLGLVIDGRSEVLWLVSIDELCIYAESWEEDFQLVVGSSVEVGCRDNVVAGVCNCCNGHELGSLTRTCCDGRNTPF
jgi:hypothetical protein